MFVKLLDFSTRVCWRAVSYGRADLSGETLGFYTL